MKFPDLKPGWSMGVGFAVKRVEVKIEERVKDVVLAEEHVKGPACEHVDASTPAEEVEVDIANPEPMEVVAEEMDVVVESPDELALESVAVAVAIPEVVEAVAEEIDVVLESPDEVALAPVALPSPSQPITTQTDVVASPTPTTTTVPQNTTAALPPTPPTTIPPPLTNTWDTTDYSTVPDLTTPTRITTTYQPNPRNRKHRKSTSPRLPNKRPKETPASPRAPPRIPTNSGWANFASVIKQDDRAVLEKNKEHYERHGGDVFRPEMKETYEDRRGGREVQMYEKVGGEVVGA